MNKGFRVLLQIFQVLFLLGALLFMTFSFLMAYVDFGATAAEERFVDTWIIGFALLSIAVSPALWALSRRGQAAQQPSAGGFDRAPSAQMPPAPQQQPPGAFEPMQSNQAPAPPASSYGQGPAAGGITPTSSPQAGSPWNTSR